MRAEDVEGKRPAGQRAEKRLLEIIRHFTRESGVRSLEREIASICRKVAREVVKGGQEFKTVRINAPSVRKYLGVPKYRFGKAEEISATQAILAAECGVQVEFSGADISDPAAIGDMIDMTMAEFGQAVWISISMCRKAEFRRMALPLESRSLPRLLRR